jgi:cellulose 1,4-beta-cellobiosidase
MTRNMMAVSALFCAGVMAGGCGMWSDRDNDRSGRSSSRSSTSAAQGGGTAQGSSAQMAQVQQALKAKGYDPGTTNAQTQQALRKFQQANGLSVTGTVDSQTAKALGISTSGAAGSSSGASGSTSGARGSSSGSSSREGGSSTGGTDGSSSSGSSSRSGAGSSTGSSGRSSGGE